MDRRPDQFSSPGSENERADNMMRQRMARAAQQQQQQQQQPPPGSYMQQQQPPGTMAPQGAAPSMPMPRPVPAPLGAPRAVNALTGPGRRIPPSIDPLRSYKSASEKNTGSPTTQPDMINGVNQLLVGVVTALAFSAIFVLPRQLQVFWVLIVGLTLLMQTGMHMYKEMMQLGNSGGEDSARQAEYAWMLLFSLMGVYSAVMIGILIFMSWSLYGISNARTNVARSEIGNQATAVSSHSSGRHHHHSSH